MDADEGSKPLGTLSTNVLIARASSGSRDALEALYGRYLPRLQRWARGRLPHTARGMVETDDLVQETLLRTLGRVESFDPEHSGAFLGYVRRAIDRQIIDELRRASRRPESHEAASAIADPNPFSPLDEAIGNEKRERYERAFRRLSLDDQAAIAARLEDGLSYREIARELGKPSPDAARMAVSRAIVRLAREMRKVEE